MAFGPKNTKKPTNDKYGDPLDLQDGLGEKTSDREKGAKITTRGRRDEEREEGGGEENFNTKRGGRNEKKMMLMEGRTELRLGLPGEKSKPARSIPNPGKGRKKPVLSRQE